MLIAALITMNTWLVTAADEVAPEASALADTASWGLLAGVLTPLLVSVVQQPKWTKRTRTIVAAAVAIVIGLLTCLTNGLLADVPQTPQTLLSTVALVLVASQGAYGLFKTSGVAAKIENATSGSPKMPDPSEQPGYVTEGVVEAEDEVVPKSPDVP